MLVIFISSCIHASAIYINTTKPKDKPGGVYGCIAFGILVDTEGYCSPQCGWIVGYQFGDW